MEVFFGPTRIRSGHSIDPSDSLSIKIPSDKYSALLLLRLSARDDKTPYVHFLEINIPNGRIEHGDVIFTYEVPNIESVYVLYRFSQQGPLELSGEIHRARFDVQEFVRCKNFRLENRLRLL